MIGRDVLRSPEGSAASLTLAPLVSDASIRTKAYDALRAAILEMNIAEATEEELRLDERELAARLGVSRTPIREALACLEREDLVTNIPRRGYFMVRKSKAELIEMITVWAALESMAARLLTQRASDAEIGSLRDLFKPFHDGRLRARLDAYSDANLQFHQRILDLARCETLRKATEGLWIHIRSIRHRTIGENHRAEHSIADHMEIIGALEARDAERAERLVRDHALNLAAHLAANGQEF